VVAVASCASAASLITLGGFHPEAPGEHIYVAVEGQNPAEVFSVHRNGARCPGDNAVVRVPFTLSHVTTTPTRLAVNGSSPVNLYPPGTSQPSVDDRDFSATQDATEQPVQRATLTLGNPQTSGPDDPVLGNPRSAPVFLVDDDASQPFSFGMPSYSRQETFTLGIPVFRSGPVTGPASVSFTTEGSGADEAEPSDYEVLTQGPLQFAAGERVKVIKIEMRQDSNPEGDEQFTVSLVGDVNDELGTTNVIIKNLNPGSGSLRPTGRLHHPKHKFRYPQNYPWLNEIHIFTASADRDLKVRRAEMSIVKKLKDGACRWWNGSDFVKQRCIDRRWFTKGIKHPAKDYFLHRLRQKLPVSVGKKSNVAVYEIRARWWDNRNNVSKLRVGASQNRFEVIKPTKACRNNPFNSRKCKPVRP